MSVWIMIIMIMLYGALFSNGSQTMPALGISKWDGFYQNDQKELSPRPEHFD